jgi:hypothetical protein
MVPVPPDPVAVADPFDPPLQLTLVPLMLAVTAVGWVIVTLVVAVHALASVAVTVYVPAASEEAVAPVALLLHR